MSLPLEQNVPPPIAKLAALVRQRQQAPNLAFQA
jgi:hypothetical protein